MRLAGMKVGEWGSSQPLQRLRAVNIQIQSDQPRRKQCLEGRDAPQSATCYPTLHTLHPKPGAAAGFIPGQMHACHHRLSTCCLPARLSLMARVCPSFVMSLPQRLEDAVLDNK